MGLLDFNLPDLNSPEGQGLLAASLSLMQAKKMPGQSGAFGSALGQAGQQFMQTREHAATQGDARELRRLQLDSLKRQAEQDQQLRDAARMAYRSPEQANAMSMGPMEDGSNVPEVKSSFDTAQYGQALYGIDPIKGLAFAQATAKDDAPVKLAPGEQLFSGKASGYKPLMSVPGKESELPSAVKEYNFAASQGYKGSFVDFQLSQKRAGASSVSVNTGQKGLDNTLKLRGDFRSEPIYKAHQEVQSAYSQIQQSLKMASPVGDLAGATKIMKLLDPGSVVRESELGMAMAASGAMDRLTNYATNVVNGTKLTPTQRVDFQKLADALYMESGKQYNSKRGEYQGIAERNGLSVPDVLGAEVSTQKTAKTMDALPKTTPAERGRKIRDTATGKTLISNGMTWTAE